MPTGNLPESGKKLWEKVYNDSKAAGDSEEKAAKKAWGAVHNAGWKKDADGKWVKSSLAEFSMRIERAYYDTAIGERKVRIVASDTDEDNRKDSMSLELFEDFIDRIQKKEQPPAEYCSEFWSGGEPYISVSHYLDANGKNVPGIIESTYIDGNYLKSKGKLNDTPLGRKCFEAVCSDLYGDNKNRQDKVRISIAFLDYKHQHKGSGFVFDRLNSKAEFCPECILELMTGEVQGKKFLKGLLIHEAMTRVPVNTRTEMEVDKSMAKKSITRKDDAKSIVGDELAEELEKEAELVGKSDALVYRSEEAPGEKEEECKDSVTGEIDPDCIAKKAGEVPMTPVKESEVEVQKDMYGESPAVYVPPKPYGGATSLKEALALQDAKETMWQISDLWYMTQDIKENIMDDEKIEDKASALNDLLDEFKGHIKSLSEVEEIVDMKKEEITEIVKSVVTEVLPKPVEPKQEELVSHPLDSTFVTFKAEFDRIMQSEATEEEKLHSVQEPFNVLGTTVVSVIKSSVKPKETTPELKAQSDMFKAFSDVMSPIAQKLDLVLTQLSNPVVERPMPAFPPRRSIPPALVQQSLAVETKPTEGNPTPKLRELIRKTV